MPDDEGLREELAAESARHGLSIGVDQRLVLCTCGWRDMDETNLNRPLMAWSAHVADALLPVVERHAARRAAEALRAAANEDWVTTDFGHGPGFAALTVVKTGDLHARADALAADGTEPHPAHRHDETGAGRA